MGAASWYAMAFSVVLSVVYGVALMRYPLEKDIPTWVYLLYYFGQATCFAIYFMAARDWYMKVFDLLYFAYLIKLAHDEWDKRKKNRKPARALGRVVDIGHRLAVLPTRG